MATMQVIDMVQNILSSMDSDEVNSIDDTEDAIQVATVLEETYFELIELLDLPTEFETYQLDATTTSTPTHMKLPDAATRMIWIKYNSKAAIADPDAFVDILYMEPKDFIDMSMGRTSTDSTIDSVIDITGGTTLLVRNDVHPNYWTSFDDEYIVFDSYKSSLDNPLVSSKTLAYGSKEPSWTMADSFTPDLPANLFPLLLAEAKSTCFVNFKQSPNPKEEQKARRLRIRHLRTKWRENGSHDYPNYGR